MASTPEDQPRMMTLQTLALELKKFHSFGGLSFGHRRQPLTRRFVFLLVFVFLDTISETIFTFAIDYDEKLFFVLGNICVYFFGASYRYFPIIFFYKVIGLFTLIVHVASNYDWIELVDQRLAGLGGRVVVTGMDMAKVVRIGKLFTLGSVRLWAMMAFVVVTMQTFLVHFGRLPWYLVLPTFFNIHFTIIVYTYIHWCLLGQYYLLLLYCFHLVRAGTGNLMVALNGDDHNNHTHIEQALADFEVIASCVHQVWQYALKIYLIHLIVTTCMIPVYIFNAVYADLAIYLKPMFPCCAAYFLSVVGFLSYLPGRIDMQLEPVADRLYRSIVTKNVNRSFPGLRYKYLKFGLHALNGLGLTIAGYRINLSTCISLATVYVTVFSLLIHSRNSVGRIEFVQ